MQLENLHIWQWKPDRMCHHGITELDNHCNLCWKEFPTQTELDIHIGLIHRKIPFSSCSYISTEQSLQVIATYVGRNLRMTLNWTHTWGRYMERLSPQVVLGMIMPLFQVAYVLPMTRLWLIVVSISTIRDGLGSHNRAMHVKKHNPENSAGRSESWYHVLKKRGSDTCTKKNGE